MHSYYVIENHSKEVNCCAFSKRFFASCSGDKTICVHSVVDFSELPYSPLKVFRYGVNFVAFDKTGNYLASACNDGKAHVFQLTDTDAKIVVTFHHSGSNTAQVCSFSSDSSLLVTGSADGSIALWDLEKKKLIREIAGHPEGNVYAAAFTPCDKYLVTGSGLGDLRVWEIPKMKMTMQTKAHDEGISSCGVTCLQFSPSYHSSVTEPNRSYLMASCGQDNKAKIWIFNVQSRGLRPFQELMGHHGPVSFCSFSTDGQRLATSSFDKSVIIWDPVSKEQLMELLGHEALVTSVAFSFNGYLASTSYDKKIIIWKTDTEEDDLTSTEVIELSTENKTDEEVQLQALTLEPLPQVEHPPPISTTTHVSSSCDSWSCDDVVSWLSDQVKLPQYSSVFSENEIDGAELQSLTSEMLQKDLGIVPLGHRNKILRAIKSLHAESNPAKKPSPGSAKLDWRKIDKAAPSVKITDNRPCKIDDGFTYERDMIQEWFNNGKSLSPMSNKTLSSRKLIPNQTLKSLIAQYLDEKRTKTKTWVERSDQT